MGYLLYKCSRCRKNLAVAQFSVGRTFSCPHCKGLADAPEPSIRFPCTWCKTDLFAPNYLREMPFVCPNCEKKIKIPRHPTLTCPSCQTFLEVEDEYFHDLEGTTIRCPSCDAEMPVPRLRREVKPNAVPVPAQGGTGKKPVWTDFARKTLRLDRLLADLPQVQSIDDGLCPYCSTILDKLSDSSYVCKRCDRVISIVRRAVKKDES